MRFLAAIAASLAAHAVLALALAWWLGASGDRELARLDLSSVELSFAEEEDDSAAAAPTPPPAPPSQPERPKELPPPEEKPELEAVEPDAVAFAEPVTEVRPLPEAAKVEEPRPEQPAAESAPAPAAAPRQAKVDAPPRPRRAIRPDYPAEARRRGIEGETTLELTVDAAGRVSSVTVAVSSGHPELDAAALRAVKAAEFMPAKSGGSPVESSARIKLVFRLK